MGDKLIRVLNIVGIMDHGGVEHLLMDIYRNIDKKKIQFDFLLTREKEGVFDQEIKELGGQIYKIPSINKVGYLRYKKNIDDFFINLKNKYDIVHCHLNSWSGLFLPIAKKHNIPVRIAHSHISEVKVSFKRIPELLFRKYHSLFINNNATHFFACSKQAGKWLFGKKIAKNKLNIIKNAINTDNFKYKNNIVEKKRQELNIRSSSFIIGHVGRFAYQKNHEFLIDVFEKISKKNPNAILCLVGAGKLEKDIRRKVYRKNLKNKVKFLGLRNDVNELMMMFDVFLFPSRYEGFGIVALEAQTAGAKTIVSEAVPEEVDITDLVERISLKKSPSYWAERILECKNDDYNKDYQQEIIEAGYDIKNTAEELQKFYINQYSKIKHMDR